MDRVMARGFPELAEIDEEERLRLGAAATRAAATRDRAGLVWQIVVPLGTGVAAIAGLLLIWPSLASSLAGRIVAIVPGAVLAPWLHARMRSRWLRPHLRALLDARRSG